MKYKTYKRRLKEAQRLCALDPKKDSPKGRRLLKLTDMVMHYEYHRYRFDHGKRKAPIYT